MYCNNCGAEIEESAKFCVKCGAKIEDLKINVTENDNMQQVNVETLKEDVTKQEKTTYKKKKLLPKQKRMVAVISVALVLIGICVGVCVYVTSPSFCIKNYANAIVGEEWDKVFSYTTNQAQEDEFADWATEALTSIDSYVLVEIEDGDEKTYKVTFQDTEGKEIWTNYYVVKKQEKNKMLLFPNWKIEDSLKIEKAVLQVQAGVQLFVDGKEIVIEGKEQDAEGNVSVTLQNLYEGPHSVKMTKQFYQDYEDTLLITEQTVKEGLPALQLTVSDSVVQDVCFEVVSGSQLLIDDVKVEKEYLIFVEDGVDTYVIPFLEKGEHKIKASKKYYDDYEETLQVDSTIEKSFVEKQNIQESEAWRVAYQEFLTAVMNRDMETIEEEFINASGSTYMLLYENYNYQVGTLGVDEPLSFSLIYLNDDSIPELLIDTGLYGLLCTYYEGEVRDIFRSWDGMDETVILGGERGEFGFALDEGLILDGGVYPGAAASTYLGVWKYESGNTATRVAWISEDRESPEYSFINEETIEQEKAAKEMEKYWNKASNITTQLLNEGNITNAIWGVEIDWESSIDPSVWLNAFINQWSDDEVVNIDGTALEVAFYDINQDGIPEIRIDYVGGSNLYYLDNNMKLCWICCDLCWVLPDGAVVVSYYRIEASEPIVYMEYQYDEETGTYKELSEAKWVGTEEFSEMEDNPNMDSYKIMGNFAFEESTSRLEELAKHAASTMGVTSDITEAREKNELKSGAEFKGIGLSEKVKAEDFKAYLDAYCENYTYMVTEKKFGYMQDYLYYGDKPSTGYDCVTEMQRMLGYDVIDSMTLTSTKIKDVTKVDENTVQMRTVENYHAYYNMSLEQLKKNTKIYEQCKDKVNEDVAEYQVEVYVKQKVFYELKLDGNQWKFYRYMEGVDQTTEVVDCVAL